MPSPTAYLQFDGNCAEALTFYAETLGGEVLMMSKYSDAPPNAGMQPVPAHWVMHARLAWPGGLPCNPSDELRRAWAGNVSGNTGIAPESAQMLQKPCIATIVLS